MQIFKSHTDKPLFPVINTGRKSNTVHDLNDLSISNVLNGLNKAIKGNVSWELASKQFSELIVLCKTNNKEHKLHENVREEINKCLNALDLDHGGNHHYTEALYLALFLRSNFDQNILTPNIEINANKAFPDFVSHAEIDACKEFAEGFNIDTTSKEKACNLLVKNRSWDKFDAFKAVFPKSCDEESNELLDSIKDAILNSNSPNEVLGIRNRFPKISHKDFANAVQKLYEGMIFDKAHEIKDYEIKIGIKMRITDELTRVAKSALPGAEMFGAPGHLDALNAILGIVSIA